MIISKERKPRLCPIEQKGEKKEEEKEGSLAKEDEKSKIGWIGGALIEGYYTTHSRRGLQSFFPSDHLHFFLFFAMWQKKSFSAGGSDSSVIGATPFPFSASSAIFSLPFESSHYFSGTPRLHVNTTVKKYTRYIGRVKLRMVAKSLWVCLFEREAVERLEMCGVGWYIGASKMGLEIASLQCRLPFSGGITANQRFWDRSARFLYTLLGSEHQNRMEQELVGRGVDSSACCEGFSYKYNTRTRANVPLASAQSSQRFSPCQLHSGGFHSPFFHVLSTCSPLILPNPQFSECFSWNKFNYLL